VDVISKSEKLRFKTGFKCSKTARLSDERMCRGREFQLLDQDTQKAQARRFNSKEQQEGGS